MEGINSTGVCHKIASGSNIHKLGHIRILTHAWSPAPSLTSGGRTSSPLGGSAGRCCSAGPRWSAAAAECL